MLRSCRVLAGGTENTTLAINPAAISSAAAKANYTM